MAPTARAFLREDQKSLAVVCPAFLCGRTWTAGLMDSAGRGLISWHQVVFQVHGVDVDGAAMIRKRVTGAKVLEFFAAQYMP